LAAHYDALRASTPPAKPPGESVSPFDYRRRVSEIVRIGLDIPIGGGTVPRVLAPVSAKSNQKNEPAADVQIDDATLWGLLGHAMPGAERGHSQGSGAHRIGVAPLVRLRTADMDTPPRIERGSLVLIRTEGGDPVADLRLALAIVPDGCVVGIAEAGLLGELRAYRLLAAVIDADFVAAESRKAGTGRRIPICIALPFQRDDMIAAAIAGALLIDGIGDCLYLPAVADPRRLGFTLLQAVKARVTRADYVACPSCGRTQFDLMDVTAHIKAAIMGCIVNGPGEMADADFGYVGSGPGKIDLYQGRTVVRRNLPFDQGREELISLIKQSGKWKDRPA
jgi:hypothetical protein